MTKILQQCSFIGPLAKHDFSSHLISFVAMTTERQKKKKKKKQQKNISRFLKNSGYHVLQINFIPLEVFCEDVFGNLCYNWLPLKRACALVSVVAHGQGCGSTNFCRLSIGK